VLDGARHLIARSGEHVGHRRAWRQRYVHRTRIGQQPVTRANRARVRPEVRIGEEEAPVPSAMRQEPVRSESSSTCRETDRCAPRMQTARRGVIRADGGARRPTNRRTAGRGLVASRSCPRDSGRADFGQAGSQYRRCDSPDAARNAQHRVGAEGHLRPMQHGGGGVALSTSSV